MGSNLFIFRKPNTIFPSLPWEHEITTLRVSSAGARAALDLPFGAGASILRGVPLPHYEVRMGPLHDLLLRADMLLLSSVHNVAFLENLHRKCFGFFTFQLDLKDT